MLRRHVFVYGTLRRGEQRDINRLKPAPVFVGQGWVDGALYDLGDYPGVLLDAAAGTRVRGEIYRIEPDLESVLDEIEEVWPQPTGEYRKRETLVSLDQARLPTLPSVADSRLLCLVYELVPGRVGNSARIELGDWVLHRKATAG